MEIEMKIDVAYGHSPEIRTAPPCIMSGHGLADGLVVWFISETSGLVLRPGPSVHKAGDFVSDFMSARRPDVWAPFRGTIQVTQ
jgi:hypothetical protein